MLIYISYICIFIIYVWNTVRDCINETCSVYSQSNMNSHESIILLS